MIHSVFELGDTLVREVMVPRTDMVTIDSANGPAPGDDALPALGVLPGAGDRRRTPTTSSASLYFKDVARRLHERPGRGLPPGRRRRDAGWRTSSRRANRSTTSCARCSAGRRTWRSWSTSTAEPPDWSPSRTSSRRSSGRSPTSTTPTNRTVSGLGDGQLPGPLSPAHRRARRAVRPGAGRRGRRHGRRSARQGPRPRPDRRGPGPGRRARAARGPVRRAPQATSPR